jgi:hypothetical protein
LFRTGFFQSVWGLAASGRNRTAATKRAELEKPRAAAMLMPTGGKSVKEIGHFGAGGRSLPGVGLRPCETTFRRAHPGEK